MALKFVSPQLSIGEQRLWVSLYGAVDISCAGPIEDLLGGMSCFSTEVVRLESVYAFLLEKASTQASEELRVCRETGGPFEKGIQVLRQLGRILPVQRCSCLVRPCLDVKVDKNIKHFLTYIGYRFKHERISKGKRFMIPPNIIVNVFQLYSTTIPHSLNPQHWILSSEQEKQWIVHLELFAVPGSPLEASESMLWNVARILEKHGLVLAPLKDII